MEELISKKELLEKYGISYGALYRWKRMGLIPEEWFEKKSAVTGQETFFPRAAITERIELILELKDKMSLEEIAAKIGGKDHGDSRTLKIVWDGGTTQIPLGQIRSVTVTVNKGNDANVMVDITSAFAKTADIDVEHIEEQVNAAMEKIDRRVNIAVEKVNSRMSDVDASIEQAVRNLDRQIAEATKVINDIMNRKGND